MPDTLPCPKSKTDAYKATNATKAADGRFVCAFCGRNVGATIIGNLAPHNAPADTVRAYHAAQDAARAARAARDAAVVVWQVAESTWAIGDGDTPAAVVFTSEADAHAIRRIVAASQARLAPTS